MNIPVLLVVSSVVLAGMVEDIEEAERLFRMPWNVSQVGETSRYEPTGDPTINGEGLTCAHRSLALGTWVRVTRILKDSQPGRSIRCRIIERSTMGDQVIDLSKKAAEGLGIVKSAKVKVDVIP